MFRSDTPVIVVTGATNGIGLEIARQLLTSDWRVVLHGPTMTAATDAAAALVDGGADASLIEPVAADFRRLDEVRAMGREIAVRHRHVDVLVNNAAIAAPQRRTETIDGNELTFQVNSLAPFLLTEALADLLRAAPRGRMVAVSSAHHRSANIDWADPQRRRRYTPLATYGQSKLVLTMLAKAVALQDAGFAGVSVHPGSTPTALSVHYRQPWLPVDEAAAPVVRLCQPDTEIHNGAYYDRFEVSTAAPLAENPKAVDRVCKLSSRLVGEGQTTAALAA